jgi:hypothetical protein
MVKNYLKHILFYVLEVVGAFVNTLCAIFSCYPRVELGISFLMAVEQQRYVGENEAQTDRRQDLKKSAQGKFEEARKVS